MLFPWCPFTATVLEERSGPVPNPKPNLNLNLNLNRTLNQGNPVSSSMLS